MNGSLSDALLNAAERRESGVLYSLHYWLGLPWRCRLFGHTEVIREWYDGDGVLVEQRWRECERCKNWMGHA